MIGCVIDLLLAAALIAGSDGATAEGALAAPAAEARVVEYLKAHVRPGQPVVVSDLYSRVFTSAEERAVLDRLFNTFFKLPLAIAQQQAASGRPPTLAQLAEQFRFAVPGQADVMLRIMESDPRLPRFIERDPATGEIARVDVDAIRAHPRFGRLVERTIGGWQGRPAPGFTAVAFDGSRLEAAALAGQPHLVYFWFSGCPPCLRTTPLLAELAGRFGPRGLRIVALNADRVLDVPAGDEERAAYAKKAGAAVAFAHAADETLAAYGSVSVFPSFFFVDRRGLIVRQLSNYQDQAALDEAARAATE